MQFTIEDNKLWVNIKKEIVNFSLIKIIIYHVCGTIFDDQLSLAVIIVIENKDKKGHLIFFFNFKLYFGTWCKRLSLSIIKYKHRLK